MRKLVVSLASSRSYSSRWPWWTDATAAEFDTIDGSHQQIPLQR